MIPTSSTSADTVARTRAWRLIVRWALTLHIYISMAGFLLLLLFAVTGLTLNHGDFGLSEPHFTDATVTVPAAMLASPAEERLAAHIRQVTGERGRLTSYRADDQEIELLFTAPGRRVHALITPADGVARIETETRGWLAVLGDLHKGRDTGRIWAWVIDITAVLFVMTAITGIVTLSSLRARRRLGFGLLVAGSIVTMGVYVLWVGR